MKIKLSKSQWEEAGKRAGWIKESQHYSIQTDWHGIEWDEKTDEEIAAEEGRDIKTVRAMRSRIAPRTVIQPLKPDSPDAIRYSPRGPGMWNKEIDTLLGLT